MLQTSAALNSEFEAIFDALGSPVRRQILRELARGPLSVGHLAAAFSVSRPAISRHLAQLEEAGLIRHSEAGTRNVYRLDADGFERTSQWLSSFWDEASARLQLVADNLDSTDD